MKIKIIGTSSGRVSNNRNHTSFIISFDNQNMLVDAGDGVSRGLKQFNIDVTELDFILITHMHPDHFSGLGTLITQMKQQKRNKKLSIVLHTELKPGIESFLKNAYLIPERMNFDFEYIQLDYDREMNFSDNFSLIPKLNSHLDEYMENASENDLTLSSCSFLFKYADKNLFYTSDIAAEDDLYLFNEHKIEHMISEVTHVNIEQIKKAAIKQNIKQVSLVHYPDENIEELKISALKTGFILQIDGDEFKLS